MKITLFYNISYLNLICGNHSHRSHSILTALRCIEGRNKTKSVTFGLYELRARLLQCCAAIKCKLLSETRSFMTFCMLELNSNVHEG